MIIIKCDLMMKVEEKCNQGINWWIQVKLFFLVKIFKNLILTLSTMSWESKILIRKSLYIYFQFSTTIEKGKNQNQEEIPTNLFFILNQYLISDVASTYHIWVHIVQNLLALHLVCMLSVQTIRYQPNDQ